MCGWKVRGCGYHSNTSKLYFRRRRRRLRRKVRPHFTSRKNILTKFCVRFRFSLGALYLFSAAIPAFSTISSMFFDSFLLPPLRISTVSIRKFVTGLRRRGRGSGRTRSKAVPGIICWRIFFPNWKSLLGSRWDTNTLTALLLLDTRRKIPGPSLLGYILL